MSHYRLVLELMAEPRFKPVSNSVFFPDGSWLRHNLFQLVDLSSSHDKTSSRVQEGRKREVRIKYVER